MSALGALVTVLGVAVGAVSLAYTVTAVVLERRQRAQKLARLREEEARLRSEETVPSGEPRAEQEAQAERRIRELIGGFSVRDYARSEAVRERVDAYLRGASGLRSADEEGMGIPPMVRDLGPAPKVTGARRGEDRRGRAGRG